MCICSVFLCALKIFSFIDALLKINKMLFFMEPGVKSFQEEYVGLKSYIDFWW